MNFKSFFHEQHSSISHQTFYHGSMNYLPINTILTPKDDYEQNWSGTDFYNILEMYRPKEMLAHKESVFMCDNPDDVDNAGGGTEYLFTVKPLGKIEKHDLNWGSEISMLLSDGHEFDSEDIMNAAHNYWTGIPHTNESVWEYLTPKCIVLNVEQY